MSSLKRAHVDSSSVEDEIALTPTASPTMSPVDAHDAALAQPPPLKKLRGRGGGLKKSTLTTRNNARVSFKGNFVSRRCIQDIKLLDSPRQQLVNVVKVTAVNNVVKANGKGVLVPSAADFYVLNLSKLTKAAFVDCMTQTPDDKAWIYVYGKGVVRVTFAEIAGAKPKPEGILMGTLRIDVFREGDARIEAQKVGTRLRPEDKLAHCIELDFAARSQDAQDNGVQEPYRYLWVDESIFEKETSEAAATATAVATSIPCSPVQSVSNAADVVSSDDKEMMEAARILMEIGEC